jgi:hypothetical protein
MKNLCSLFLAGVLLGGSAIAAEWQWSVPVKPEKPERGPARAWLWIPPACKQVRGIVVAQHNMEEISILENPKFRVTLAEMNFAEVWVAPFFDHMFRFHEGSGEVLEDMLNRLAEESGYAGLKFAPLAPIGHSAAASWPYSFAAWKPERALCALSVSGQWPYFRHPDFAPDIWGDRNIDFVPCLETMGEYEAAVLQSHMFVPVRNTSGAAQHIIFPEIPDQTRDAKSLKLNAVSDSGEPVHYLVREGPAEVNGDVLTFAPIPPGAKIPVKVKLIAWQFGRSSEPCLESAEPVERMFKIVK